MIRPRFSVIMPTFNRSAIIRESLNSVFHQTFEDFEFIVVDDGSTDNTCDVISEYSQIKLILQENSGPGAARNLAVQHASGEYLAFLDSDDIWFPWTLETYQHIITDNPGVSFVAGRPNIFSEIEELKNIENQKSENESFEDYLTSGDQWRWFGVSSFVIRKGEFEKAGRFTDQKINSEDADLALRLGTSPGFIQVISPVTFGYRNHTGNITNDHKKSAKGLTYLLDQEKNGVFPGGDNRKTERWTIISRHIRPHAVTLARAGQISLTFYFYFSTIKWHVHTLRWKFIFSIPLLLFVGTLKRFFSTKNWAIQKPT